MKFPLRVACWQVCLIVCFSFLGAICESSLSQAKNTFTSYLQRPIGIKMPHVSMSHIHRRIDDRRMDLQHWTGSVWEERVGIVGLPLIVADSSRQRAPSAHIGSVMALLATFDEAKVLPPEHDPQANQLIHSLIQLQSTVMKSHVPEMRDWILNAVQEKRGMVSGNLQDQVRSTGLTMDVLESLVDYAHQHSPWEYPAVAKEFHAFNVQQEDWILMQQILVDARNQLRIRGESLSNAFARRRLEMPGAVR